MPRSRHRGGRGTAASRGLRPAGTLVTPRSRRKKPNRLYLIASVVIAVLVIASFAFASGSFGGRSGGAQTGDANAYIPGVGEQFPVQGSTHIPVGETFSYSTEPPTSGNHWPPGAQARCGFYEDTLPDESIVHDLEHSNIIISYNLGTAAEVDQLRDALDNIGLSFVWGITRAYSNIEPGTVAIAAWGILDSFQGVDEARLSRFFDAYAGTQGSEVVPC